MLLRTTDPFRDFDRLTQQLLGTTKPPRGDADGRLARGRHVRPSSSTCPASPETIDLDVERNVLTVRAERVARNGDWEMLAVRAAARRLQPPARARRQPRPRADRGGVRRRRAAPDRPGRREGQAAQDRGQLAARPSAPRSRPEPRRGPSRSGGPRSRIPGRSPGAVAAQPPGERRQELHASARRDQDLGRVAGADGLVADQHRAAADHRPEPSSGCGPRAPARRPRPG